MINFLIRLWEALVHWFQDLFGYPWEPKPYHEGDAGLDVEVSNPFRCQDQTSGLQAFRLRKGSGCGLEVSVRIMLQKSDPDPVLLPWTDTHNNLFQARKAQWKELIESAWSKQHQLRTDAAVALDCRTYAVEFKVEWMEPPEMLVVNPPPHTLPHHTVTVFRETGSFDERTWFLGARLDESGYIGSSGHEFGHMLGLCHDTSPDTSIMCPGTPGNTVMKHHYQPVADVLSENEGHLYEVV